MTAGEVTSAKPSTQHLIGDLEDFPLHKPTCVTVEGRMLSIIRTETDVFALGNRCPHQGGPMSSGFVTGTMLPSESDEYIYGLDGLVIQCPWHAYEFRMDTGQSVNNVVPGRIPVFQTDVRDGKVYCALVRRPIVKAGS
jgi:nitrite reductase (NADH) small subunit